VRVVLPKPDRFNEMFAEAIARYDSLLGESYDTQAQASPGICQLSNE
jgi:hypothetical protein